MTSLDDPKQVYVQLCLQRDSASIVPIDDCSRRLWKTNYSSSPLSCSSPSDSSSSSSSSSSSGMTTEFK